MGLLTPRATTVCLLIALPAAYLAHILRRTTASVHISPPDEDENNDDDDAALIAVLPGARADFVIARERVVSEPLALSSAAGHLDTYLRTTMRAFAWTPQAFVMRALVAQLNGGAGLARTFDAAYLDACAFEVGDRVCGVYVVRARETERERERVVLDLSPPAGWTGPVVSGFLDCGVLVEEEEECGRGVGGTGGVRFVNQVVLWRRVRESPTLLEGTVSGLLHSWMVRWMMVRGVDAVLRGEAKKRG